MAKPQIKCNSCGSGKVTKKGTRKSKLQTKQIYFCKSCSSKFILENAKNKTYPMSTILKAISTYNLGYNLKQTQEKLESSEKIKIPISTLSSWINEYKNICTFAKLRNQAIKLFTPKTIIKKLELSHIQPYTFKCHKAKLHLLFHSIKYNNQFHNIAHFYEPLKNYLEKIGTDEFPHRIFTYDKAKTSSPYAEIAQNNLINESKNNKRASQIKFTHLKIKISSKSNFACKLAKLALNLALANKDRHEAIQNFFLTNDSTTIAVEVPIYLTNWDSGYFRNQNGFDFPLSSHTTPITGHIDILQIRNGLIIIVDYKPDAKSENPTEQLTIYALALSRKLNLPLYYFKCAWFDENDYFEFFPLHDVFKKRDERKQEMVMVK